MKALLVLAMLLPMGAHAAGHEESIDSVYIMVCKGPEGVYFVHPTSIVYAMQGLNGAPNCMAVRDTAGKEHVLCRVEGSPDTCLLAEPGPVI